jgi:DNA invertase Pin-like site-specific DNA recombinase
MTVWGYARVSTLRQSDEGISLDVQERQLQGYASMHGWTLAGMFIERGISGSKRLCDRPEGAKLLATVQAGDVIICAKLDRMFRSSLDALDTLKSLQSRSISLHLLDLGGDVTGNGIAKLVFTILAAVAEAERERIRERVATVKQDQREHRRYLGGKVPFGWTVGIDGELVEDVRQQAALQAAREAREAGASLRAIRDELAQQHGCTLSLSGLQAILAR